YRGTSFFAVATVPTGGAYLPAEKRFEWTKGVARMTLDFTLQRGVEIRGKLREEPSGKPLGKAARLAFTPRKAEKERGDGLRGGYFSPWSTRSAPDGSFRLLVPPGPGHLVAEVDDPDLVLRAVSEGELLKGKPDGPPHFYHAVVSLEPKLGQA